VGTFAAGFQNPVFNGNAISRHIPCIWRGSDEQFTRGCARLPVLLITIGDGG